MLIRFATIKDLTNIINIYNQAIEAGNATADIEKINSEDKKDWFKEHNKAQYPIYVVETKEKTIGWGALSPYRKGRGGLKETAEITYYIDYNHHGKGYGKNLIEYMISDCNRLGIKNLIAILLEINNHSIHLLEKFGFARWGLMPDIVHLKGATCGHLFYGKKINQ